MDFVTLGMFIIDDIYFPDPKPPALGVLGGAGSYAVVGARLFRPAPTSKKIGWVVHQGSDFPTAIEEEINAWETTCDFHSTPWRLTTKGWNGYGKGEKRGTCASYPAFQEAEPKRRLTATDFKYLTEKLRVDEGQLSKKQLQARCFHLICTPERCIKLVQGILDRRGKLDAPPTSSPHEPIFIWEPVPDACGPGALAQVLEAMKWVDVISPNHHELAALFAQDDGKEGSDEMQKVKVQSQILFEQVFVTRDAAVVVRCGEKGCYMKLKDMEIELPAYHQTPQKVVDPTGAGNAFLGGFTIGMLENFDSGHRFESGALYGTVAASFAVEQVGLPRLARNQENELWNDVRVQRRLDEFRERIGGSNALHDGIRRDMKNA